MANNDSPPMYTDTPLAVIPTPKFETGNVRICTYFPSQLAHGQRDRNLVADRPIL